MLASVRSSLTECIYDSFSQAIPTAINRAVDTCDGWGKSPSDGGLRWPTYKATVRRNGAYCGSHGKRDFNEELFEPISRQLATGWERAFQRRVPQAVSRFAATAQEHLEIFRQGAADRAEERFAGGPKPQLLFNQISAHQRTLKDLPNQTAMTITEHQRDANRRSIPMIIKAMTSTYEHCTAERGSILLAIPTQQRGF